MYECGEAEYLLLRKQTRADAARLFKHTRAQQRGTQASGSSRPIVQSYLRRKDSKHAIGCRVRGRMRCLEDVTIVAVCT